MAAIRLERIGEPATSARPRRHAPPSRGSQSAVVLVTGTDADGDAVGRLDGWPGPGPAPQVIMAPEPRGRPALAPGQRVLARLTPIGRNRFEGRTVEQVEGAPARVLGVFRTPNRLVPTDRRAKAEWLVPPGESGEAEDGEIVLAVPIPGHRHGLKPARVIERLGREGDARSVSLVCIHTHHIPTEFDPGALEEAAAATGVGPEGRDDLRAIPLVTIDGEDARDFDDAVWAEPDGDGYSLLVAIADVAHYVRPGSALDRDARLRGNSVYFPDRVVPMLPEALQQRLVLPASGRGARLPLRRDADRCGAAASCPTGSAAG